MSEEHLTSSSGGSKDARHNLGDVVGGEMAQEEGGRIAAVYLRQLADRIETGELMLTDITVEREVVEGSDGVMVVTHPTPYYVITIRLRDSCATQSGYAKTADAS